MIRHKGQSSQAKHEHYPAIIIFFGKFRQNTENHESKKNVPAPKTGAMIAEVRFVCKLAFTGKSLFFTFCP